MKRNILLFLIALVSCLFIVSCNNENEMPSLTMSSTESTKSEVSIGDFQKNKNKSIYTADKSIIGLNESIYIGEMTYYMGKIENGFINILSGTNGYKSSSNVKEINMTHTKATATSIKNGLTNSYQKTKTSGFTIGYKPEVKVSVLNMVDITASTWSFAYSNETSRTFSESTYYELGSEESTSIGSSVVLDVTKDPIGTNYVWSFWADIYFFQTYKYNTEKNCAEKSEVFYKIIERKDSYRVIRAETNDDYPVSLVPTYITEPMKTDEMQADITNYKEIVSTISIKHGDKYQINSLNIFHNWSSYDKLDSLDKIIDNKVNYSIMKIMGYKKIKITLSYIIDVSGSITLQHKIVNKTTGDQHAETSEIKPSDDFYGTKEYTFIVPIDKINQTTNWIVEIRAHKNALVGHYTISENRNYKIEFLKS